MFMKSYLKRTEFLFLLLIYFWGVYLRLFPRLSLDPHLLVFDADIWYRLCLAQNLLDNGRLPAWDIRYLAYGKVPFWYTPLSLYFFGFLTRLFDFDLPTVSSRLMPFFESLVVIPMYFLCRRLYNIRVAVIATIFLSLTPSFVYWTGISTPQTFTLFLIPIMILLWIKFLQNGLLSKDKWKERWMHLLFMGIVMAINFLVHLSVFTLMIILLFVHSALVLEGKTKPKYFLFLCIPMLLSQIFTIWWWLPLDLYWWWTQVLTTSAAYIEGIRFLLLYGKMSAILGHLAFITLVIFIIRKRKSLPSFYLVPIAWAIFPMIESHNEAILKLIGHYEWTWYTIAKPLESFRFYCFLAPPLAVCFGLACDIFLRYSFWQRINFRKFIIIFLIFILSLALLLDMFVDYRFFARFTTRTGVKIEEIQAAVWFRNHSKPTDRILTEYYIAQMFGGICGGKSLMGSKFPLKNVNIPYITEGWLVQQNIYSVYTTNDPGWIGVVLKKYGCTHVFLSKNVLIHIEYITQSDSVLEDVNSLVKKDFSDTLINPKYFKTVYENKDVKILQWIAK
jgi:asparagine N-glycosylation enzyme membrane subunit Stt3